MDMKPFENCRVAVCFSGQSRTFRYCAESIKNFFSSRKNNTFTFFGHTTNKNYYKKVTLNPDGTAKSDVRTFETLDIASLTNELQSTIGFAKLQVEEEIPRTVNWGVQLYSQMKSNYLKQQYEVEHNMMFDLVIRTRFDQVYPHTSIFEDNVNFLIEEKTLYSHFGLHRSEYILPNPSQCFHFGSSLTLDLVDSFYNVLITGNFNKLVGVNAYNPGWTNVGDGAMIHKWCNYKNIHLKECAVPHAIIRKHSLKLDYRTEWQSVVNAMWWR